MIRERRERKERNARKSSKKERTQQSIFELNRTRKTLMKKPKQLRKTKIKDVSVKRETKYSRTFASEKFGSRGLRQIGV